MIWRSGGALLNLQAPEIHLKTGKSSHLAICRGQDEVSFQRAKSAFWEADIGTCQVKERSLTPSVALLAVLTWQDPAPCLTGTVRIVVFHHHYGRHMAFHASNRGHSCW